MAPASHRLSTNQALAERARTVCLSPRAQLLASPPPTAASAATWTGYLSLGTKLRAQGRPTALPAGDRFVLGEMLGAGATGQVLAVRDRNLERDIAVKVLAAADDGESVERFVAEAQIIAGLSHPNVLPVHDLDLDDQGRLFFTMTRVEGRSLGAALERSTRSPHDAQGDAQIDAQRDAQRDARIASANDVVNVFLGVLRAMAYAHHRGLIHQDIKPENIMLGDFGEVILVDWGSAARLEEGRTTHLYGTPLYMSPEQARGEYADQRSDIYCLGASLFHALTLRAPTWAEDPAEFLDKKRRGAVDPPTPAERLASPPALLDIALMALRADPAARYQSAEAMLRDLEHYQAGLAVAAHRESWLQRLRRWYAANTRLFWTAALAAAALALALSLLAMRRLEERATWLPVFSEDFDHGGLAGLERRWVVRTQSTNFWPTPPFAEVRIDQPGILSLDGDGLISSASDQVVDLSSRDGVSGDVRVEWEYTPLGKAQNLNCFLGGPDRSSAFIFHVAGFGNPRLIALTHGPGAHLVHANLDAALQTGRTYHFALEHAGRRLRLAIDGRTYVDFEDDEAIGAGAPQRFGFDNYPLNRNRIAHIRVLHRAPAQRVSPLEIGDALYQLGLWAPAEQRYQDLILAYGGSELGTAAEYRLACCELQLGHAGAAARRFDDVVAHHPGSELVPYALGQRLGLARAAKDEGTTARLRQALGAFPGHPVLVQALMDISTEEASRLRESPHPAFDDPIFAPDILERVDSALATMRRWSGLYATPLSVDAVVERSTAVLEKLGESRRLQDLGESAAAQASALYQMGRYEELLARFPLEEDCRNARFALGRLHELASDPQLATDARARACLLAGDEAAIAAIAPDSDYRWFQRLQDGQFAAFLAAHPTDWLGLDFGETVRATVLLAAGRYEQALSEYHQSSVKARALLGLGRIDEALRTAPYDSKVAALVAVRELEDGRSAEAHGLLVRLARSQFSHDDYHSTFPHRLLPAVVQAIDGQRDAACAALRATAEQERDWFGQRLSYIARYACGDIGDQEFRAQPYQLQVESRLLLAQGLRCEIAGDAAGAAQHYRELLSLPFYRSTLAPCEVAFMSWRLRARGLQPPPYVALPIIGCDL